jgi:hypothetical protein
MLPSLPGQIRLTPKHFQRIDFRSPKREFANLPWYREEASHSFSSCRVSGQVLVGVKELRRW